MDLKGLHRRRLWAAGRRLPLWCSDATRRKLDDVGVHVVVVIQAWQIVDTQGVERRYICVM